MTEDEIRALDAEQMEADMRRAEAAPGVFFFPRAHNQSESERAERWLMERIVRSDERVAGAE